MSLPRLTCPATAEGDAAALPDTPRRAAPCSDGPRSPMRPRGASRLRLAAGTLAACLAVGGLAGCENMSERQKGTAVGAGAGAGVGAVIGAATGGRAGTGAVIGAAVGAVAGNLWSKRMEDKRRSMEEATAGAGIAVERTTDNQLKVNVPNDISFDVGRSDIKPELRPVLDQFAHGLDAQTVVRVRRPHRQHRQRCGQRPALAGTRPQRRAVPGRPWRAGHAHRDRGPRLARAGGRQRHGRGPGAQPARRDLPARAAGAGPRLRPRAIERGRPLAA